MRLRRIQPGEMSPDSIEIDGQQIRLSNLDKVFFPSTNEFSAPLLKQELLLYYIRMWPFMQDYLRDRPVMILRYPDGIAGAKIREKHFEEKLPAFAESVWLFSPTYDRDQQYVLINNLSTLVWLAQLGAVELHPWASRCSAGPDAKRASTNFGGSEKNIESSLLNFPDFIWFDIDPYIYSGKESRGEEPELFPEGFDRGKEAALWLKDLLDSLGIRSYIKTSGKTGLHVFVPIVRNLDFDSAKSICETLCAEVLRRHPHDLTMEWSVESRTGKVFLDHNMNVRGKTLNCPFTPRALPTRTVSWPFQWTDLEKVFPTNFTIDTAPEIAERKGNPWETILRDKQDLTQLFTNS